MEGYRHLYTMGVAYNFNASMQSMIPAVVTIGLCGLSGLVLSLAFDDVNIMNFGSYLFLKLFGQMGNGLFSILLYILLSHVLWFFGIHGTNTLEAVSRRLFESEVTANQAMAAQGLVPTHMFSKTFLDTFVFIGGSGCACAWFWPCFLLPGRIITADWPNFPFLRLYSISMSWYCLDFPSYSVQI